MAYHVMDGIIRADSVESVVDDIMRYMKEYLIPFFERANSCKTALNEVIQLESHFNGNSY